MEYHQDSAPTIGIIGASTDYDDLYALKEIISASNALPEAVYFKHVDLYRYGLAKFDEHSENTPDWWFPPNYSAALDWSRELSSLDGIILIIDGAKGHKIALNALDYLQSEITLKPVDLIVINSTDDYSLATLLKSRLSELRAILLPNGFELTEDDADILREPFLDDYFSVKHRQKIDQTLNDLAAISGALKSKPRTALRT